ALREIPYAAVHVVVQAFEASAVPGARLDGFGFLIPGGERREILGSIWASSVFPDHVPPDTVMFRTMLGGWRRPDLADAGEAELAELARRELIEFCGLSADAKPVVQRVIRWKDAIPQYTAGHQDRVAAADTMQARCPGLFLSGNGLRGVAMLNCVAEGDRVAASVLAHLCSSLAG
ncbi:MAG: protoporphyrinogen oxidase, partial [Myxococcota bacterium]